jgi:sensor histidine kinase regulating citrate/malate metabolism
MKTSLTDFINKISNKYFINNKLIGDYVKDLEFVIGDSTLLLNISKLEYNNIASGFVFSFRRKDEIDALKNEILSLKKMSEILRTQSHEYSNKLHIIAGLIQLGEYEEASNLIISESRQFQSFMKFIDEKINDKYISALLISKMSKAGEIGCKLLFNENSTGIASPVKNSDILVTAIGNIIDNAIEAASSHNGLNAIVELTFNSDKDFVEIIVEDNGPGIQNTEKILESGYSTKGSNRGLGLSIAKNIFDRFNASVDISFSKKYKGAMFRISFKNQDAL